MMQRGSSTMSRNILIGSITVIILLTILYYMKRVEVGRLNKDMEKMGVRTIAVGHQSSVATNQFFSF